MQGWIKLHRKLLQSNVFQNEKLFKVFMYCLMKASHEGYKQLVGLQFVELEEGQFVFGRKKASSELNMKESTLWKYIKLLESNETININSNNKFSVITVVNWGVYQHKENEQEQQNNNKGTTKEQQNNTNKNVKNDKNDKNNTSRSKLKFETHHLKLANLLFKEINKNNPNTKEPNLNEWANTFRLMMERDKRNGREIQDLILWSQQHDFWYKNILSPNKLRKQFDRLQMEMNPKKTVIGVSASERDYADSVGDHGIRLYK